LANSAAGSKLGVVKSGTGAWTLNGVNTYTGGTTATGGTLTIGSAGLVGPGALTANGGTVVFAAGNPTAQKVASLSITGTAVDQNDNDMVVGSATPKATIVNAVRTARNSGNWNGSGLTSSSARNNPSHNTTLGVLSGAEYTSVGGNGTFSGQTYSAGDTLVKYTWNGDANLDGRVTFDDYVKIDTGFNTALTGWLNGDFNYSGSVTFDDYVLIDIAFNQQNGTLGRAIDWISGDDRSASGLTGDAMQTMLSHWDQFGTSYAAAFLAAVPEPSVLGLASAAFLLSAWRRRSGR